MPAKLTNLLTEQTDEDNLVLALSHLRHLRDQSKIWSTLSHDTAVADEFWYAMECLDDAVEKLDVARDRLQDEREDTERRDQDQSVYRDLRQAIGAQ